jgi:hypothetical protein
LYPTWVAAIRDVTNLCVQQYKSGEYKIVKSDPSRYAIETIVPVQDTSVSRPLPAPEPGPIPVADAGIAGIADTTTRYYYYYYYYYYY